MNTGGIDDLCGKELSIADESTVGILFLIDQPQRTACSEMFNGIVGTDPNCAKLICDAFRDVKLAGGCVKIPNGVSRNERLHCRKSKGKHIADEFSADARNFNCAGIILTCAVEIEPHVFELSSIGNACRYMLSRLRSKERCQTLLSEYVVAGLIVMNAEFCKKRENGVA